MPDISSATLACLDRAAARVVNDAERSIRGERAAEQLRASVGALVDGVLQALAGETPALPTLRAPRQQIAARRLLDGLRTAFLREPIPSEGGGAEESLRVARAIETVQRVLEREQAHRHIAERVGPEAQLIAEVAHDMRSPLGAILLLLDTIRNRRSGPITPVQERQLGLIYGASFGLSSLVNDLIELARDGDHLVERDPIPFSIAEIMRTVSEIVQPITEEKGLQLLCSPPDMDWRMGYPAALTRVLLNLVTNALKNTDEGFVQVTARQVTHTRVEFSVLDSGRGLDPAMRDAICLAFHGDSSGGVRFSCAGLGLSICRKLVTAMNGELKVDAPESGGCKFAFETNLPLAARM
ncbi:MAG: HAMP domain-containing sensor histidine kinase [Gemmatimonadaceae bacterium]